MKKKMKTINWKKMKKLTNFQMNWIKMKNWKKMMMIWTIIQPNQKMKIEKYKK